MKCPICDKKMNATDPRWISSSGEMICRECHLKGRDVVCEVMDYKHDNDEWMWGK